jgi:DNA-binding CsgD family transcriptional regulator
MARTEPGDAPAVVKSPFADLVGRDEEVARLQEFVRQARLHGGSFLIQGERGVGKSTLLEATARGAAAEGILVVGGAGLEDETDTGFSLLNLLLRPLRSHIPALDPRHRTPLSMALGLGDMPTPAGLDVANAIVELLQIASVDRPLLVIVDDLPRVDRSSAAVLGFIARRLAGRAIGFLAASNPSLPSHFDGTGISELTLRPLRGDDALDLLHVRYPVLARRVAGRLIVEACGNPLALLELPAGLSDSQLRGAQTLPAVFPLTPRCQATFAAGFVDLPPLTVQFLLVAALEGTGDLRVLQRVSGAALGLEPLSPAEQAHLVHVDENRGRLTFLHPLTRAAVVGLSTSAERRVCHLVLAQQFTDQPGRRAWHLAAASVGPDETVSELLVAAAERAVRRGDGVGAVAALLRAADMSPIAGDRGQLLARAAYLGAGVTGDLDAVAELLADSRRADPERDESLQAAVAGAYILLNSDGGILAAHRLLVTAIEARTRSGECADPALVGAVRTLFSICLWAGRPELWAPLNAALEHLMPVVPRILYIQIQTMDDPVRLALPVLDELDQAIEGLDEETDLARIVQVADAAIYVDRIADCREALMRVIEDGRAGGAITAAIDAMMMICVDDVFVGRWDDAELLAAEGLQLCDDHGYGLQKWPFRLGQALLAAGRGDEPEVAALTSQMTAWAVPRRIRAVEMFAQHVRGLAALGRGDFEEAYHQLAAISPPGSFAPHVNHALRVPLDLVEAAVHTHRTTEATAHVTAMREARISLISPRLAVMVAGSAALAAPQDRAADLFEDALALPDLDRCPFETARVHLAYGEHLRRDHTAGAARAQLTAAARIFRRLAATPWIARADRELRATGQTRTRTAATELSALTPQEHEIASMAAAGLTNKQIGERLFLSHRTVATHLYRAFPKLGIASRAALRDALADQPEA